MITSKKAILYQLILFLIAYLLISWYSHHKYTCLLSRSKYTICQIVNERAHYEWNINGEKWKGENNYPFVNSEKYKDSIKVGKQYLLIYDTLYPMVGFIVPQKPVYSMQDTTGLDTMKVQKEYIDQHVWIWKFSPWSFMDK